MGRVRALGARLKGCRALQNADSVANMDCLARYLGRPLCRPYNAEPTPNSTYYYSVYHDSQTAFCNCKSRCRFRSLPSFGSHMLFSYALLLGLVDYLLAWYSSLVLLFLYNINTFPNTSNFMQKIPIFNLITEYLKKT